MDERMIRLTLAAQIAGHIVNQYFNYHEGDEDINPDTVAIQVADLTVKIVDQVYAKL